MWGTQHDLQIIQTVSYLSDAVPSTPSPLLRSEPALGEGLARKAFGLREGGAPVGPPASFPPTFCGAPGATVSPAGPLGCLPPATWPAGAPVSTAGAFAPTGGPPGELG